MATSSTSEQVAERTAENKQQERPLYQPAVDIVETDDAVLLKADLPGVGEESVEVSLDKNVLTIRGSVEVPHFEGYSLVHAEYGIGDYERAFTISSEIDRDRIEASLKNGVLTVKLPKAKQAVARKIAITAG